MLNILIVDSLAERRHEWYQVIVSKLKSIEQIENGQIGILPNLSINTSNAEGVIYQKDTDIYILTADVLNNDTSILKSIRQSNPSGRLILAVSDQHSQTLLKIESLVRQGIEDVFHKNSAPAEFVSKLLILNRTKIKQKKAKVIMVDSGKGGQGVTTIVAALGDSLNQNGQKVLLIDFDYETQDLSRFLQARPYLNENLLDLLKQKSRLNKETFQDCLTSASLRSPIDVLPPALASEYNWQDPFFIRLINDIFDIASEQFDYVIVDSGCLRQSEKCYLARYCEEFVTVVSNDPAASYSLVNNIRQIQAIRSLEQKIILFENHFDQGGFTKQELSRQVLNAFDQIGDDFLRYSLTYSKRAGYWPASGESFFSLCGRKNNRIISNYTSCLIEGVRPATNSSYFEYLARASSIFKDLLANRARSKTQLLPFLPIVAEEGNIIKASPEDLRKRMLALQKELVY